jgi:rod shape-determining protein MreD
LARLSVIALILISNIILQSAVFPFIEVYGVKPDTLLILVISFALLSGNPLSATAGLFGGIIQDLMYGHALGLFGIQYMLVGYLSGLLYKRIPQGMVAMPVIVTVLASILRGATMLIYLFFTNTDMPFLYFLLYVLLPEAVYTTLAAPLVYYGIHRLFRYKFMYRRWYFRR